MGTQAYKTLEVVLGASKYTLAVNKRHTSGCRLLWWWFDVVLNRGLNKEKWQMILSEVIQKDFIPKDHSNIYEPGKFRSLLSLSSIFFIFCKFQIYLRKKTFHGRHSNSTVWHCGIGGVTVWLAEGRRRRALSRGRPRTPRRPTSWLGWRHYSTLARSANRAATGVFGSL
jgi:hypothetical protein